MNSLEITSDSPKARAIRLKKVRTMLGLSAEELGKEMGYTRQTISYWENSDNAGGISPKGAAKLVEIAKKNGIICDVSWIMYGISEKLPILRTAHDIESKRNNNEEIKIDHWRGAIDNLQANLGFFKELESFLLDHDTTVIAAIPDNAMEPIYEKGDWVGGKLTTANEHLDGKICIIEINGKPQVRMLKLGNIPGTFNASYLKRIAGTDFELQNISITNVAYITRVWRK